MSIYTSKCYCKAKENKSPIEEVTLENLKNKIYECKKLIGKVPGTKTFCVFACINEKKLSSYLRENNLTYNSFIQIIGFPPNRNIVTESELFEDLYKVYNTKGKLTLALYEIFGKYNKKVIYRILNVSNWTQVTEKLSLCEKYNNYTDEEILADIRQVAKIIGRPPLWEEYNKIGKFGTSTISRRFKGITNALLLAGFSEEELSGNIKYLAPLIKQLSKFGSLDREVAFENLYSIRGKSNNRFKLRFDFKLNENLLIELDGWSHFDKDRCIKTFKISEADFINARINDRLKEVYCKSNGYNLLRLKNEEPWTYEHLKYRITNTINGVIDEYYYDFSDYDHLAPEIM